MPEAGSAVVIGPTPAELPADWQQVRLEDAVDIRKDKVEPNDVPPDTPYLSLEHIAPETGEIVGRGTAADVRSTKSRYELGDVLYGRLRPYLNKVAMPDAAGICSTDILVLVPRPEIRAEY